MTELSFGIFASFLEVARRNVAASRFAAPSSSPPSSRPDEKVTPKRKPYILIVEDDEDLRDVVKQILVDCGYRVRVARPNAKTGSSVGLNALEILDKEYMLPQKSGEEPCLPRVILLDLHMPGMDGLKFLITLAKTRPQFDQVPVIAMSDSPSVNEFTRWAIQTDGIDMPIGALPKPFARELLIERVAEHAGLPPDDANGNDEES